MKRLMVLGLTIAIGLVLGCQPPPEKSATDSESNPSSSTSEKSAEESKQLVQQTVEDFLAALRNGDEATATSMLTAKAQEKTSEHNMAIQPPGSQTAEFSVTEVEVYPETGEAQALSTWSDNDSRDIRQTYDIVWLLRREKTNWRILGMATKVFEDQRPIILNFEDPNELMREKQWAEEEIARRNAEEPRMATKPEDGATH